jgi:hypothetical protein
MRQRTIAVPSLLLGVTPAVAAVAATSVSALTETPLSGGGWAADRATW